MEDGMKTLIAGICFGLFFLIGSSAAIECYKCGGLLSQDATCEDKFNPSGVSKVQCSGSCAKYKGEKDGMQLVWRTCFDARMDDDCVDQEQMGVSVDVCYCNSELCNAAATSGISIVTLLAMVGVGLWLAVRQ